MFALRNNLKYFVLKRFSCTLPNSSSDPTKLIQKQLLYDPERNWKHKPECHPKKCDFMPPRLDEVCGVRRTKGPFQKHWIDCPEIPQVRTIVCPDETVEVPRPRLGRKKEISKDGGVLSDNPKCIKLRLPGCPVAQSVNKCIPYSGPSGCEKILAPCPSYTECKKPAIKEDHPHECDCWLRVCEPTD